MGIVLLTAGFTMHKLFGDLLQDHQNNTATTIHLQMVNVTPRM
jgi:hypothetical protein